LPSFEAETAIFTLSALKSGGIPLDCAATEATEGGVCIMTHFTFRVDMRTATPSEHQETEALLPWYAAGTLSRRDANRVEQALAGDRERTDC
jgi:hypothetical protein